MDDGLSHHHLYIFSANYAFRIVFQTTANEVLMTSWPLETFKFPDVFVLREETMSPEEVERFSNVMVDVIGGSEGLGLWNGLVCGDIIRYIWMLYDGE